METKANAIFSAAGLSVCEPRSFFDADLGRFFFFSFETFGGHPRGELVLNADGSVHVALGLEAK